MKYALEAINSMNITLKVLNIFLINFSNVNPNFLYIEYRLSIVFYHIKHNNESLIRLND